MRSALEDQGGGHGGDADLPVGGVPEQRAVLGLHAHHAVAGADRGTGVCRRTPSTAIEAWVIFQSFGFGVCQTTLPVASSTASSSASGAAGREDDPVAVDQRALAGVPGRHGGAVVPHEVEAPLQFAGRRRPGRPRGTWGRWRRRTCSVTVGHGARHAVVALDWRWGRRSARFPDHPRATGSAGRPASVRGRSRADRPGRQRPPGRRSLRRRPSPRARGDLRLRPAAGEATWFPERCRCGRGRGNPARHRAGSRGPPSPFVTLPASTGLLPVALLAPGAWSAPGTSEGQGAAGIAQQPERQRRQPEAAGEEGQEAQPVCLNAAPAWRGRVCWNAPTARLYRQREWLRNSRRQAQGDDSARSRPAGTPLADDLDEGLLQHEVVVQAAADQPLVAGERACPWREPAPGRCSSASGRAPWPPQTDAWRRGCTACRRAAGSAGSAGELRS